MTCTKETKELIGECCIEFIHLLSSESTEICEKENKKTMMGEHVISALNALGFESFVPLVQETLEEHSKSLKDRERKSFKLENSGLTPEELLKSQEELFARARERMSLSLQSQNTNTTENNNIIPTENSNNADSSNNNSHSQNVAVTLPPTLVTEKASCISIAHLVDRND